MNYLVIISDVDFEDAYGASYNRIISYAFCVAKHQNKVIIISSKYDYTSNYEVIENTEKIFILKSNLKHSNKATLNDYYFLRAFKFYKKTTLLINKTFGKNNNYTYLLYTSTLALTVNALFYFKLLNKKKVFVEKNELKTAIIINYSIPFEYRPKYFMFIILKIQLLITAILTDVLAVFFNGIIVISTKFYKLYSKFNRNIIIIPILADKNIFSFKDTQSQNNIEADIFKIGYFGSLSEKKDGTFSLIKAVQNLNNQKIELHLYGFGTKYDNLLLKNTIKTSNNIVYHGFIKNIGVYDNLIKFDLLAAPRHKNLQTTYGFSTKLAEYLISAIPVLASDVSDNSKYLKDNINAFIIPGEDKIDIKKLTEKIEYIYHLNKDELKKIALNGRNTALQYFQPMTYSNELVSFLNLSKEA